jgi:hypothetical protein
MIWRRGTGPRIFQGRQKPKSRLSANISFRCRLAGLLSFYRSAGAILKGKRKFAVSVGI